MNYHARHLRLLTGILIVVLVWTCCIVIIVKVKNVGTMELKGGAKFEKGYSEGDGGAISNTGTVM